MSPALEFDEAASRAVEAAYLTPDVVAQRCTIMKALEVRPGERVLDIGSGPGLLAYDLAATVGAEGRLCGIDMSEAMVAMARSRCAGQSQASFEVADACTLPFDADAFDVAVSTQVYEYVADIPGALAELRRVLRPGGRVAILDADYDSLVIHTEDPARLARIVTAWDEHFVHAGLPRTLAPSLREAGFVVRHRDVVPMFNPEYHPNTFGYHLTMMMALFAVGRCGVTKEDAEAWLAELAALGRSGSYFYSLNRYLFIAEKPAG